MTYLNKEKEIELSLYNDVGTLASYNKYIEATKGDISVIYMDNAATTMHKPKTVIDAVVAAMSSMGNAGRGANEASLSASRKACKIIWGRKSEADCVYNEFDRKSEYCD